MTFSEKFAKMVLGFDPKKDRCYRTVIEVLSKIQFVEDEINTKTIANVCGADNARNFSYAIRTHFVKNNDEINAKHSQFSSVVVLQFFVNELGRSSSTPANPI